MRDRKLLNAAIPVGDDTVVPPLRPTVAGRKAIDVHSCRRDLAPARSAVAVEAPDIHAAARRFEVMAVKPGIGPRIARSILPRLVPCLFSIASSLLDNAAQRFLGPLEAFAGLIEFQFELGVTQTQN